MAKTKQQAAGRSGKSGKPAQPNGRLAGRRVLFDSFRNWSKRREAERLLGRAQAHGATAAKALDAKLDYLVFPDATSGKTLRKRAQALIAKGANIQVLEADDFYQLTEPTGEELLAMMRGGKANGDAFNKVVSPHNPSQHVFTAEKFDGLDLSGFEFDGITFEKCSFVGAKLDSCEFEITRDCNFSKATGKSIDFQDVTGSKFAGVRMAGVYVSGSLAGADFTNAKITDCQFQTWGLRSGSGGKSPGKASGAGAVFRRAVLPGVELPNDIVLDRPDFSGADLTDGAFQGAELRGANFRGATLKDAVFYECTLPDADFSKADLRGANLGDADLAGAKFAGADVTGCNFRGAKVEKADLNGAKGYAAQPAPPGGGPALQALAAAAAKATRLELSLLLKCDGGKKDIKVTVGGSAKWGFHVRGPYDLNVDLWKWGRGKGKQSFTDSLTRAANALGNAPVRFETVKVSATKAGATNKELLELAVKAVAEAFGQTPPDAQSLTADTKAHREKEAKKGAEAKQKRAEQRAAQEKKVQTQKARAIAKLSKEAGQVNDFDTFMKAIVVRTDKSKVDKATKMLKASGFQLYNDVADTHLLGVVKSQTDPTLVYACRLDNKGHYACCTQNLNICGGLHGSICKHLLVLIIGLVKAGQLDPAHIDGWVAKTAGSRPALDKEKMGEIFIRYKGAEAGEVDWRPTETVPEDYYAL